MISNSQVTRQPVSLAGTTTSPRPAHPAIPDVREAIERMSLRINAVHADRNSLRRTALGLAAIHRQLTVSLDDSVRRGGWSPENRVAEAALVAMARKLELEPPEEGAAGIERMREHLQHAVFRAVDAATLLDR